MAESLAVLEERRQQLYELLTSIGDFRPGMISARYRKWGRGNCACARPGHGGHGPQYLWNTTQRGRSRAQNLHLGPQLQQVESELANYRRFVELCEEIVEVNEQICRLRPVPKINNERELAQLKKTLQRKYSKKWRKS
ncbi:MAG: hypothetical protein M3Q91_12870 [Acidobacteriota bacterium]|nr:hypothetical protein [Acidobacteriota bacterium]